MIFWIIELVMIWIQSSCLELILALVDFKGSTLLTKDVKLLNKVPILDNFFWIEVDR